MPKVTKQPTLFNFFKPISKNERNDEVVKDHTISFSSGNSDQEAVICKENVVPENSEDVNSPQSFTKSGSKLKRSVVIESDDEESPSVNIEIPNLDRFKATETPLKKSVKSTQLPSSTGKFLDTPAKSSNCATPSTAGFITPARRAMVDSPSSSVKKPKQEERYSWLEHVMDGNKEPRSSPNYDPRTLYIPPSAWQKFTPFEKQYWEIKSKNFDTVVFFKKGKFFELYEDDATIGHQKFDLKMTDRVNMKMVGVPESSFSHWASQFIAKGYKVAKVEQLENSMGKQIRDKASMKKEESIIKRELTSVLTSGTLVDGDFLTSDMSTYCMSIKEKNNSFGLPEFGICFIDTSTAEINLSHFTDDKDRTQFETIITQVNPKEVILEKNQISKEAIKIMKNNLINVQYNYLNSVTEFWNAEATMDELTNGDLLDGKKMDEWPSAIRDICDCPILLSALGGLISYLRNLKLDKQMISANNVKEYKISGSNGAMVLDGQTLINLEIFKNSMDASDQGTLFKLLNHCTTPFGKRLFRK